jgi:hypothetical protein
MDTSPTIKILSFLTFFFFVCSSVWAQEMIMSSSDQGVQAELKNMEKYLIPYKGKDVPEPRFDHLWITNDGQYHFTGRDSVVVHKFDAAKVNFPDTESVVSAFATVIYSDTEDDEPPKIIEGTAPINFIRGQPDRAEAVPDTGFVRIQKNHLNIVPDDTSVFILSAENNLPDSIFVNAFLLFLYDAPLSIINRDLESSTISSNPIRGLDSPTYFTEFKIDTSLYYSYDISQPTEMDFDISDRSIGESFQKVKLYSVTEMEPGVEYHIFPQVKNEQVYLEQIPSGGIGGTRFMAVLMVEDFGSNSIPFILSDEEQDLLNEIKFNSLTDEPLEYINNDGGTSQIVLSGPNSNFRVVGVSELYSTVARSHDPNQIQLQACECPANTDAVQKIICRVDFENIGAEATKDVSIRIPFPEEIDVNTYDLSLISLFPDSEPLREAMDIKIEAENNELIFDFPGLRLEGKSPGADNFLNRTGHITFEIYTKPGTNVADIPFVQACIIFDKNEPFCTPEAFVELVGNQTVHESLAELALDCGKCVIPAAGNNTSTDGYTLLGMPLWLLLLIIVIIAIALYFAFFYDEEE